MFVPTVFDRLDRELWQRLIYRFEGAAVVYEPGSTQFDEGIERLRDEGVGANARTRVTAIAVIDVQQARPLASPAYDRGFTTEAELARTFHDRVAALHEHLLDRTPTS